MVRFPLMSAFCGAMLLSSTMASAGAYEFSIFADTRGPIDIFGGEPAISNAGAAFTARLDDGRNVVMTGPDIATDIVVDDSGPYWGFSRTAPINNTGDLVIPAFKHGSFDAAIITGPAVPGDVVAEEGAGFGFIDDPAIGNGGDIAFSSGSDIYVDPAGPAGPSLITQNYGSASAPSINGSGTVAFIGTASGIGEGIFVGPDPSLDVYADTSGDFVGFNKFFDVDYGTAISDGGTVVFLAEANTGSGNFEGVFTGSDATADRVADNLGDYDFFYSAAINASDDVVFMAYNGALGRNGLYSGPDAATDVVIEEGMMFDGYTVNSIRHFGNSGLADNGDVAFVASLQDDQGLFFTALVIASPSSGAIPAPPMAGMFLLTAVLLVQRRKKHL